MTTTAKVICYSAHPLPGAPPLLTVETRYPKFIHGELMTHRVFSRNASSSRAIPVKRYLEEVRSDELRATPSFSVVNAPGMQGGRPTTVEERSALRAMWRNSAMRAADEAEAMDRAGGAKQDVNRLLEPYVHINVVITATEWNNFFGLRLNKAAMPEARDLAIAIWEARSTALPSTLATGAWHLPYAAYNTDDNDDFYAAAKTLGVLVLDVAKRVSVARCARVSYISFQTERRSRVVEDLPLHDSLARSGHWSPFEHQATPDEWHPGTGESEEQWAYPYEHGNFVGWRQLRQRMPGQAVAALPEEFR